jgi:hypothetical protein
MSAHPGVAMEAIAELILIIRGQRVILDSDLAGLYGVETRALVQAVQRNPERFPEDFMFRLTPDEHDLLRSQNVISKAPRGGRRNLPYAFTEQGVSMLSSVLRSPRAVQVNIEIMRAFVRLRQILASNAELYERLNELEQRYDSRFKAVFEAIRQLMTTPQPTKRRLGFAVEETANAAAAP